MSLRRGLAARPGIVPPAREGHGPGRRLALLRDQVLAICVGTVAFAAEALSANLSRWLGYASPRILGWLGFAGLLFSFAYAALQMVQTYERRLLSIENELTIARRLQQSILPATVPELREVRIAAAFCSPPAPAVSTGSPVETACPVL